MEIHEQGVTFLGVAYLAAKGVDVDPCRGFAEQFPTLMDLIEDERGGYANVAAYLAKLDLSSFNPKEPPPKTAAFWDIVDANRAPEDAELADVLDSMGNPDATTLNRITAAATGDIMAWLQDRKNRRAFPHRLEKCGYVPVRNGDAKDGLWKIRGVRQVVYGKSAMPISDRFRAAGKLTE